MVSQQSDRIDAGTPAYGSVAKASPLADAARFLDLPHPRSAKLVHAFLAGFIASLALLIVFALAYALALIMAGALPTDRTVLSTIGDWFRGLTHDPLLDRALPNPFVAVGLFTVGGIAWALLYAAIFEQRLTGPDWHRVRPRLAGICGSDLATIDGRSSRWFEPIVSFPFVPGHEIVGDLDDDSRVVIQPTLTCAARGVEPG